MTGPPGDTKPAEAFEKKVLGMDAPVVSCQKSSVRPGLPKARGTFIRQCSVAHSYAIAIDLSLLLARANCHRFLAKPNPAVILTPAGTGL
jgi:hypothetical protein